MEGDVFRISQKGKKMKDFFCKLFIYIVTPTTKIKERVQGFAPREIEPKMMQSVRRRVLRSIIVSSSSSSSSSSITTLVRGSPEPHASSSGLTRGPFAAPWAAVQTRGCKVHGSDVFSLSPQILLIIPALSI